MKEQQTVARFLAEHELDAPPAYRLLDLASEVGELAKDANESTAYGSNPGAVSVESDELGDALFSLLSLAESLDIDAGAALDEALAKYESRIEERGEVGSRPTGCSERR
ncbi:MazG nucleotide pyrophosphohydrolase domain-containing protein [Haladaptatus salinisoli]|uniref:MazG nucleotide pyrophosphohydrolase domain-containing protein n=1 Tax=Haladaptatus salinisoli TaxID=2884876 RepID=UPI001D0B0868|nr:MazG nucleotide pyrophosphohydrolase domain-containing protein [Haladaptatus salinisoli]